MKRFLILFALLAAVAAGQGVKTYGMSEMVPGKVYQSAYWVDSAKQFQGGIVEMPLTAPVFVDGPSGPGQSCTPNTIGRPVANRVTGGWVPLDVCLAVGPSIGPSPADGSAVPGAWFRMVAFRY